MGGSPIMSPSMNTSCSSPVGPQTLPEKPPVNSPAYSDISDDGEDGKVSKPNNSEHRIVNISQPMMATSIPQSHLVSLPDSEPAIQYLGSVAPSQQAHLGHPQEHPSLPPPPHLVRSGPVP